ncbi:MAG TPA: antitoxin Xre-like helix-turn-helix domain-containing protein [Xanthobacteraceae bacterium]|jgi:putative toxin-antitoxin system antitoxin component (TIGR02293 family)
MTIHVRSLAALLGVHPRKVERLSSFDLADEVRRGLSVDAIDRVSEKVAPDDVNLRHRLVPKATLARRRRTPGRRLSPEESDRVARLARIWELAMDVWKSEPAARRFLARPHPMLAGRVPREFAIESELGAREVENLIGRVKYGIPS